MTTLEPVTAEASGAAGRAEKLPILDPGLLLEPLGLDSEGALDTPSASDGYTREKLPPDLWR